MENVLWHPITGASAGISSDAIKRFFALNDRFNDEHGDEVEGPLDGNGFLILLLDSCESWLNSGESMEEPYV